MFAFEVTADMFDFMEARFEPPDANELLGGEHITVLAVPEPGARPRGDRITLPKVDPGRS